MGAQGQEDWFDEVMPGLDDGRPGGKRRFPWPGRHGKDDGDEAEARTRPRIGVRVGVATVIVTGLMVTAGLTAGMVSANRRERLADASAACERSARAWSAGSAAWGRDRDRIMGSVDLDALRATDPDMADTLERLSADPVTPAGCTAGGDTATLDADAKRISKAADRLAKRSERLEKAVAKAGQTGQVPARTGRGRRAGPAGGEHGGPVQGAVPVPSARTAHGTGGGAARRRVRVPGGHGPALPGHRRHGRLARLRHAMTGRHTVIGPAHACTDKRIRKQEGIGHAVSVRAFRTHRTRHPRAINGGGPMMHLVLVIAVVIILAVSCLLTFALCRAATRRDMLEARWREESAGSVGEESHESA